MIEVYKIIKHGFRKTKLGWIPEEWEVVNLSKIVKRLDAGVSVNSEDTPAVNGEFGILKTSCVYANDFNPKENKTIKPDEISRAKLNPKTGRIIISRMNTPELVGACGYVKADYPNLFLPDRLWQTTFKKEFEKSGLWLFYLLNTSMYRYKIQNLASGTSNSMKNISKSSILKLLVPLPPLPEQQKIATILSTWDKAIELTQRLIEAKEEQKKGLMQRLLTGKVRMKGFSGEWEEVKLGDIFKERNQKDYSDMELLSIGAKGVYPQSESNKKDSSNSDKSKYKRICPGDIGYNTMRMWQGRSAVSELEGIVSPAYTIVTPKKRIDVIFMGSLFQHPKTINKFWRYSQGLVGDTLNCKFTSFALVKIKIPPTIGEQKEISKILKTADKEIETLNKKLELLYMQKKGLMQVLLTGKIRVLF